MAKRILLADDSITIQKVVELTFSDGDYEVTAVNNGAKAIQKLSEMRPDVILSDIIMPEKNGYEVCEYVKSHPEFRTIPVILLTGTFEPFDPDRADKAGCDAVVTKPFESQSLIHKVEELIAQSQSQAPNTPAAAAAPPSQFATGAFQAHGSDIFDAPSSTTPPAGETPFETPAPAGGETRAFPRMSFEDLQRMANEPAAPAAAAASEPASPWDEQPPASGGETRAFPKMSFEELPPPTPASAPSASPWDEPAPSGGETRTFPRPSFEELKRMAEAPAPPTTPEPSPWDSGPEASAAAGDTMTPFEAPSAAPPAAETSSPWDEQPSAAPPVGETRAFPKMSFDELERMESQAPPMPEHEPEPSWTSAASSSAAFGGEAATPPTPEPSSSAAAPSLGGELTDEQIDRIARRVVQLMSDQVIRTIAWEVIPDLAEMVVKERIRQLESEG
jgi:CheY-like chemotaxis protein